MAIAREQFDKHSLHKGYTCNNRGAVGNGVIHAVRAKGLYNEDTS
jgi:hypothetical protein